MSGLPRAGRAGAALLVLLAAAAVLASVFPIHLDDPYITFRYGRNLAEGRGLAWNPGEPPVEGYTSTLWMLFAAAVHVAGVPALLAAKLAGIGAFLVLLLAMLAARPLAPSFAERLLATALLALAGDVAILATSGMEHVLFALLAFLPVVVLAEEGGSARRRGALAGTLLGLACWTRPEGHLVALFVLAWLFWRGRREEGTAAGAVCLALLVPLHIWRLATYHALLPNTFHAKHTGAGLAATVTEGLRYVAERGIPWAPAALLGALAALRAPRGSLLRLTGALVAAFWAVAVLLGGDATAFPGFRLVLPVLPFVALLAARAVGELAPTRVARWGMAAALLFLFVAAQVTWAGREAPKAVAALQGDLSAWRAIAAEDAEHWDFLRHPRALSLSEYLRKETPPGESVAVPWAGRVPYESGLPTIDLLGLNDPHIARIAKKDAGVDVKYDAAYVLSRRPYFVCENLRLANVPMERIARLTEGEMRAVGALRQGQRDLLRNPILLRDYEPDPNAPNNPGRLITCFRRVR